MKKATKTDKAEKKIELNGTNKAEPTIDVKGGGDGKAADKKDLNKDVGKATEAAASGETKKKQPKTKDAVATKTRITRFDALAQVMKKTGGFLSKDQIAEQSDALYAKQGGTANPKEALWATGVTLAVLGRFGLLEEKDGTYFYNRSQTAL